MTEANFLKYFFGFFFMSPTQTILWQCCHLETCCILHTRLERMLLGNLNQSRLDASPLFQEASSLLSDWEGDVVFILLLELKNNDEHQFCASPWLSELKTVLTESSCVFPD